MSSKKLNPENMSDFAYTLGILFKFFEAPSYHGNKPLRRGIAPLFSMSIMSNGNGMFEFASEHVCSSRPRDHMTSSCAAGGVAT
jgi:hypothetical protein